MTHVGIDVGQFVSDPYASGIQRVLQYLAREWPTDEVPCDFVVPFRNEFLIASAEQATTLFDAAFEATSPDALRTSVEAIVQNLADTCVHVDLGTLVSLYTSWLLPEVSYSPAVLERLRIFRQSMPVTMIGYDALPMTDPSNYRFKPGSTALVSEYFHNLAKADSVVCISDYARHSILDRLRRDRSLPTLVAHPGGDHVAVAARLPSERDSTEPIHFLRVGTMEARKMPVEILKAFQQVRETHNIKLTFVGAPSASDPSINKVIEAATQREHSGVVWLRSATDEQVHTLMRQADVFLSVGIEGYGIPVLESIRLGTPVLYAGVQPAAELMNGSGAVPMANLRHEGLVDSFLRHGARSAIYSVTDIVNPAHVPTWSFFVGAVADAVRSTNR